MAGESPKSANAPTGAVFLSYASQDAEAAKRMCDALRAAGIEVWFDQSELRGGDAWDQSIRKQIKNCALFLPIISKHTHERAEGYFRLEWKLAVDRSHLITSTKAFLLPVVIDETPDDDQEVPERFRELQWTHLPGGVTPPAFVARVAALLGAPAPAATADRPASALSSAPPPAQAPNRRSLWIALGLAALAIVVAAGWFASRHSGLHQHAEEDAVHQSQPAATEKSIAVLPFVDLSEKHDQEYFADGIAEEIIDQLADIPELRVSARASSFYFKGKLVKVADIARELGVVHLLEGSVRKAGNRLRVTAQLIRAADGYQVWSEGYDGELQDVFAVQDQIAKAVVSALRISLAGIPLRHERGGTRNLEAYQLYLRGKSGVYENTATSLRTAQEWLEQALKLDPGFGLACSQLAYATQIMTDNGYLSSTDGYERTRSLAKRALEISPELVEPHMWLGYVYRVLDWNWEAAREEFSLVLRDNPANPDALRFSGTLSKTLGKWAEAERSLRAAITRDPLDPYSVYNLGDVLYRSRRYREAEAVFNRLLETSPNFQWTRPRLAMTLLADGQAEAALKVYQPMIGKGVNIDPLPALLFANHRKTDSDAALQQLAAREGMSNAFYVAWNFAYRNEREPTFQWLDRAYAQREGNLVTDMTGDPALDKFANDPRYKAFLRKMNLPE